MDEDLKQNLTAGETWIRGLFILLFAFFLVIARIVTGAVVVIQFLFTVFTGQTNENLRNLGASLSRYVYQCLLFVTYNADDKPFPFDEWPEAKVLTEELSKEKAPAKTVKAKAAPKKKASPKKKAATKKAAEAKTEAKAESETKPETNPETDTGSAPESPSSESDSKPEA